MSYVLDAVADFGLPNDGTPIPADDIRAAIDTAAASALGVGGAVLHFPAGRYKVIGTVVVARSDYTFYRLRIRGDGKSQSVFYQEDNTADVFRFENMGKLYSAELSFDGVGFYGGARSIYIDNPFYTDIRDCGFRGTAHVGHSVHFAGNAYKVHLSECWFYHGGDVLRCENGDVLLYNCQFGEDAGGMDVTGMLRAVACSWGTDVQDKGDPAGYLGMGPAAVTVKGGSRAEFVGCNIGTRDGTAFVNLEQANAVDFSGCSARLNGGALVRSRRMFGARGVTMTGGQIRVSKPSEFWQTVGGYDITSSRVRDTRIWVDDGDTLTVHSDLTNPTKDNVWDVVTRGTVL